MKVLFAEFNYTELNREFPQRCSKCLIFAGTVEFVMISKC